MATEAELDIDTSPAPDSCASPAPDGSRHQAMSHPAEQGSSALRAFAVLMLLLFGGLALLIWVLQPFADQVGGCGGG